MRGCAAKASYKVVVPDFDAPIKNKLADAAAEQLLSWSSSASSPATSSKSPNFSCGFLRSASKASRSRPLVQRHAAVR